MSPLARCLAFITALALAGPALADVTFYADDDFGGRSFTVDQPVADFTGYGFNDRASSVSVRSGTWQACTDANYRGRCVTLTPGDYRSLSAMGLNDRISSVRDLGGGGGGLGGGLGGGGRGRIALYDYGDFGGRGITLEGDVTNMDQVGFNDRANSAVVVDGTWQLCEHEDFGGACMNLGPGRYPNLGDLGGRISSARVIGSGVPGGPVAGPPPNPGRGRAILFGQRDLRGRSLVIDRPVVRNLAAAHFNDRASSLRVESGYWMFCSDADFEGECRTFGPGDYPTLPAELQNRISSGRRISNRYPYQEAPNWRGY